MPVLYRDTVPLPHSDWYAPEYSHTNGSIYYLNRKTADECTVPNVWYNQPIVIRREAAFRAVMQSKDTIEMWKRVMNRAPEDTTEWKDAKFRVRQEERALVRHEKWYEDLKALPDWVIGESVHKSKTPTQAA